MRTISYISVFLGSLFLSAAVCPTATAQSNLAGVEGTRFVEYYNDSQFDIGHKQVWGIEQGPGNFMFFAVNEGLCVYDGMRWRVYKTPTESVLRALHHDIHTGRLYSAGVNEYGYWVLNSYGEMEYTRLYHNEEFRHKSIDFWRIVAPADSEMIYFQAHGIVYKYNSFTGTSVPIIPDSVFGYIFLLGNRVYVQDGSWLMKLNHNDSMEKVCEVESRVINIFNDNEGALILVIEHGGIFRLDKDMRSVSVNDATNRLLSNAKITSCREYENNTGYLVGTTNSGLVVLDRDFKVVEGFYNDDNLSNTTVLSVNTDADHNIWLGLDAGIAFIDNSSNEYYIRDRNIGQIQAVAEYEGKLVVGTNKGLFIFTPGSETARLVPGSHGIVWSMMRMNSSLYVMHDQGLFVLSDDTFVPIHRGGITNMVQMFNDKQYLIAGDYNGLSLYHIDDGHLSYISRIGNFHGYTRNIYTDRNDNIWIPVKGVGFTRITLSEDLKSVSEARDFDIEFTNPNVSKSLLCTYIDGELVMYADKKAYVFNYIRDTLEYHASFTQLLDMCGENTLVCKQVGNRFWYISEGDIGYLERAAGTLTKYTGIFEKVYSERISSSFFHLNGQTVIGFQNGLGFVYAGRKNPSNITIGMVEAYGAQESVLYDKSQNTFHVPARMNNIRIYPVNLRYGRMIDYRMVGLSDEWTTVKVNDYIQLSSIPSGKYTIELRINGQQEDLSSFRLHVARPWYFSNIAILVYTAILASILLVVRWYYDRQNRRAAERIRLREKEKRQKQLEELEKENLLKEKRITELEKERLKIDIRDKDKRLANITMNSIKRNNMLGELKKEVSDLSSIENAGKLKTSIGRVVRRINSLMNNDEDWELSEKYFNTIYDGLLDRLKNNYPNLSQTDLKLCVYIKLNLATKEIAELMNVSPRSVEMARYRLRKKLKLNAGDSISSVLN